MSSTLTDTVLLQSGLIATETAYYFCHIMQKGSLHTMMAKCQWVQIDLAVPNTYCSDFPWYHQPHYFYALLSVLAKRWRDIAWYMLIFSGEAGDHRSSSRSLNKSAKIFRRGTPALSCFVSATIKSLVLIKDFFIFQRMKGNSYYTFRHLLLRQIRIYGAGVSWAHSGM